MARQRGALLRFAIPLAPSLISGSGFAREQPDQALNSNSSKVLPGSNVIGADINQHRLDCSPAALSSGQGGSNL